MRAAQIVAVGSLLAQGQKNYKRIFGDLFGCSFEAGLVLETHIGIYVPLYLATCQYNVIFSKVYPWIQRFFFPCITFLSLMLKKRQGGTSFFSSKVEILANKRNLEV